MYIMKDPAVHIFSKTKSSTALVKYKVSLFSLQLRAIKISWLSLPGICVFPSGPVFSHFSSPSQHRGASRLQTSEHTQLGRGKYSPVSYSSLISSPLWWICLQTLELWVRRRHSLVNSGEREFLTGPSLLYTEWGAAGQQAGVDLVRPRVSKCVS